MAGEQGRVQEHPIAKAVREQLLELLSQPLTTGLLMKVENIVRPARQMVENLQSDEDILGSLAKKNGVESVGYLGQQPMLNGEPLPQPASLSSASDAENFGARAIRELVSSLAGMNDSPEKLVPAIAQARELGLRDVEQSLMSRLNRTLPKQQDKHDPEPGETCGVKSERYPEGYVCDWCLRQQALVDAQERAQKGCGRYEDDQAKAGRVCGYDGYRCRFCKTHLRDSAEAAE